MCRWFAYISPTEPCLLSDVLINPANAITRQVAEHYLPGLLPHGKEKDLHNASDNALIRLRNHLLNFDGVGVAWYTPVSSAYTRLQTGPRPALYKSSNPPTNDFNFRNICENTESQCLFAHIRAAIDSAVTPVNNHPFVFGRHSFMHNGEIPHFARIKRQMMDEMAYDAYEHIQGSTDTEHIAALYMTFLCEKDSTKASWQQAYSTEDMASALRKAIIRIMEIQRTVLTPKEFTANSLNLCTTDGEKMVACRFRNHVTEEPSSLYWSETAGRTLNRKYAGDPDGRGANPNQVKGDHESIGSHTIVASEPTTFSKGEWHLIGKNCMLLVDESGKEREVLLEYDSGLDDRS